MLKNILSLLKKKVLLVKKYPNSAMYHKSWIFEAMKSCHSDTKKNVNFFLLFFFDI